MNFTQMLSKLYDERKSMILLDSNGKETDWYLKINPKTKTVDVHGKWLRKVVIHNYEFTATDIYGEWKEYSSRLQFDYICKYKVRSLDGRKSITFNNMFGLFNGLCKLNSINEKERKIAMNEFAKSDLHAFDFISMICGFYFDVWKEKFNCYATIFDTDEIERVRKEAKKRDDFIDWINDKIHYYNKDEMINIMKGGK